MTSAKDVRRNARNVSKPNPPTKSRSRKSGYSKALFDIIEKKLDSSSKRRAYVPPEQISRALRENPGVPLPPKIHDYLCDFLGGKIRAPAGRRAVYENPLAQIKKTLIPPTYARYHEWLRRRRQSVGLDGWKPIRDADWWQGPPNERAARMTCRRLNPMMHWRSVQNIISDAKKER